jgi:nicotinamide-nucleotide amidase
MTIALLATGDEIVHGDTLNTNAYHIANALSSEGLPLGLHLSCSDKEEEMVRCLQFLNKDHDVIIITGGLGPTSDDRTRFALAKTIEQPLFERKEAIKHIQARLNRSKIEMTSNNRQQALFPKEALLFKNPNGTAMGCYGQWQNIKYFLLPGPPRECLPMFDQYVLPQLDQIKHSNKIILKWLVFGYAESKLANQLEPLLADLNCQTGYRLDVPYIEFKVRCQPENQALIKLRVESAIKNQILSENNQKASYILQKEASQWTAPISIIDKATGGQLQILSQRPENTQNLLFYPDKKAALTIYIDGLDEYWQNKPYGSQSKLRIRLEKNQKCIKEEIHTVKYSSPLVLQYAAEWLSFRLFHLVNELH